jgi:hypothetical protein
MDWFEARAWRGLRLKHKNNGAARLLVRALPPGTVAAFSMAGSGRALFPLPPRCRKAPGILFLRVRCYPV